MRKTIIFCDKCDEDISENSQKYFNLIIEDLGSRKVIEICPKCKDEVKSFIFKNRQA